MCVSFRAPNASLQRTQNHAFEFLFVLYEFDVYFSETLHATGLHSGDVFDDRCSCMAVAATVVATAQPFAVYSVFVYRLSWQQQYSNLLDTRHWSIRLSHCFGIGFRWKMPVHPTNQFWTRENNNKTLNSRSPRADRNAASVEIKAKVTKKAARNEYYHAPENSGGKRPSEIFSFVCVRLGILG